MIVVDVGAHPWGAEESVNRLIDRFRPDVLFAFDPHPEFEEGVERFMITGGTVVVRRRAAAWTHDGWVTVLVDGICTGIDVAGDTAAACFGLVDLLVALPAPLVLKLDAEGAEYPLLHAVSAAGQDARLERVLVEWHPRGTAHGMYDEDRPVLRCPVEEW